MDAVTKEYIDQKFTLLIQAIGDGFQANDREHSRLYEPLKTIEELIRMLDPKADRQRIARLEAAVFDKDA